ncbi:MAG TPA: bifunctional oligoribonuclease/PAP phosphatase NrnA [Symbiobacteriaceae bacterium]
MSKQHVDLAGAARLIAEAQRILFFLHVSPDGDSIGSTLGLVRALRQVGKEAVIVGVDPVPRIYRFLPGWDTLFVPWQEVEGEWDLACLLDCGDLDRVGAALPVVQRCKRVLNIDHHSTNSAYGEYNYLDFRAAAVGEMAYRILRELKLPLDRETATCLYTSIVADTGGFRYDSTGPETHRIAAELIEAGARPYDVASAIFENESVARLKLLSRVLDTLQVDPGGKIAWLKVTRQMLEEAGALDEDAEGMVNYARSVSGVEVGLIFREMPDGAVRVGMRSRSVVDVGEVARQFGGGGHPRAAGCTLYGTLDEAVARVLEALRKVMT